MWKKIKRWWANRQHKHEWVVTDTLTEIVTRNPFSFDGMKSLLSSKQENVIIIQRCYCGKEMAFRITGSEIGQREKLDPMNVRLMAQKDKVKTSNPDEYAA